MNATTTSIYVSDQRASDISNAVYRWEMLATDAAKNAADMARIGLHDLAERDAKSSASARRTPTASAASSPT